MNKKIIWIIGIIVVIIIAVIHKNSTKVVSNEPVKIGISTMLSGNWAALGENIVKAAKLAVEDVNSSGGINGRQVVLVIEDAGLDSKTGLSAAQKLINTDNVRYIVGGTSSNGTLAAAPVANEKHALYLTPVTGGSNVDNAGEYVFRTANSDLLAGRDLANTMLKLGYKKAAVVSEVTEYTLDIKKTFEESFKANGGTVVVSEEFQPGTTDFRTIVAKMSATKPTAMLVLSQTGVGGANLIKQARQANIKVPVFTDFTFVANEDAKKIVGNFDGVYFADPSYGSDQEKNKAFFEHYQKVYGAPSAIPFHAASTYDSVMMVVDGLRAVGDDSVKVHDWMLANIQKWPGLMGTYSLDKNGNSDLGFVVKVIRKGQSVPVQ